MDNDPKPFLPVHLILGASDYRTIKTAEPPRVGQLGEPVAEKTKFGWTIISLAYLVRSFEDVINPDEPYRL